MDECIGSLMQNFSELSRLLSVLFQQLVDWQQRVAKQFGFNKP